MMKFEIEVEMRIIRTFVIEDAEDDMDALIIWREDEEGELPFTDRELDGDDSDIRSIREL